MPALLTRISGAPHSRATIVLRHEGSAQFAQNVEIIVRDGANLTVVSLQRWDDDAVHVASHQAVVERDATLRHTVVSLGGAVVRGPGGGEPLFDSGLRRTLDAVEAGLRP